jgi:hypothetical protein
MANLEKYRDMTFSDWCREPWPAVLELIYQNSATDWSDRYTPGSPLGLDFNFATFLAFDVTKNYKHFFDTTRKKSDLCLFAVSESTDERRRRPPEVTRRQIVHTLKTALFRNIKMKPCQYLWTIGDYKFVISPEGNGLDCHRHYEALVSKCIPVMEDNPLIRQKYKTLPVLWTTDYSEITPQYLEEKWTEFQHLTFDFRPLLLSFWSEAEQVEIKRRGQFWGKQLRQPISVEGHPLQTLQ